MPLNISLRIMVNNIRKASSYQLASVLESVVFDWSCTPMGGVCCNLRLKQVLPAGGGLPN